MLSESYLGIEYIETFFFSVVTLPDFTTMDHKTPYIGKGPNKASDLTVIDLHSA